MDMMKIAYSLNYNRNIFGKVSEEKEVICTNRNIICSDILQVVETGERFLVISKEDFYSQETTKLIYLKLVVWNLNN
jgi:hypothetical protein